ncbi:MAG: amidohydrolase, partial [Gemmatimonadota bacterium]|nr:amidohydrolase [Gemmatimonadota bacterium]
MRLGTFAVFSLSVLLLLPDTGSAQDGKQFVADFIDEHTVQFETVAQQIWNFAEVGYQEHQSSELLQEELREAGFSIESGVVGIPTAFVASYGSGEPVIAILAEFDALPGISQTRSAVREIREEVNAGHACGHHLFGAGSTAAAVAVKEWMEENDVEGT